MTQTPPPPPSSPPFGDDTDEAISARLDGELGGFAADHGLTEADALARLEAWSGYAARRATLEQGRLAGAPVPPLDDLTRRRLIRNALPAAGGIGAAATRPRWTWLRISAAAAAGLIVLAGIGAMVTSLGTGDDTKSSSSSGGSAAVAAAPRGDLGSLGDVSDPTAVRGLLAPAASGEASKSTPDATTQPQPRLQEGTGSTAADSNEFDRSTPATPPGPQACAAQLAGSRPVRFFATGTYQGQPVTIVGIDSGGRTIAFVVSSTDCTNVLTAISR